MMAGRGWGKTRAGAEFIRKMVESGQAGRIALIGATAADVRDVMVEGVSGIERISRPDFRPQYERSNRRLEWPNGAIATTFSAEEPDRLRGPEHDAFWADEVATWRYGIEAWDNLMFGLRAGARPRGAVTTTPRPVALVRNLVADPTAVITGGTTYENIANVSDDFIALVVRKYEGTFLARQELYAELLDSMPGALWHHAMLEGLRLDEGQEPELTRVVVGIDPAVTSGEDSDETGIIVAGIGEDGQGYVLADYSCRLPPNEWARRAVLAYREWEADRILGEVNNGGDLVEAVLRTVDPRIPYRAVRASRGKRVRAEPIAALYEQGRIHHVGMMATLEDQMCRFTADLPDEERRGSSSPDRVDALVWALSDLMLRPQRTWGPV